jgi:hypothetical protein
MSDRAENRAAVGCHGPQPGPRAACGQRADRRAKTLRRIADFGDPQGGRAPVESDPLHRAAEDRFGAAREQVCVAVNEDHGSHGRWPGGGDELAAGGLDRQGAREAADPR